MLTKTAAWPVGVYLASRVVLIALAGALAAAGERGVAAQLSGYDGQWYLRLVEHGYPTQVLHTQSTLGFLPLYPLVIRAVMALTALPPLGAALAVSLAGGLVATIAVQELVRGWWGEDAGRRAAVVFAFFPGSIVFSMAYSEGVTIPLVVGFLLAVRSRRWLTAGVLAGLATASEPAAAVVIPVAAYLAVRSLRGSRREQTGRVLAMPVLAASGLAADAVFLWVWTGSPLATLTAQKDGWHQQTNPLGILRQPIAQHLLSRPGGVLAYLPDPSICEGIVGTAFLLWCLTKLWRVRAELSPGALGYAAGVTFMALWSVMTLPKARIVLVAVPAVLVWARPRGGRAGMVLFGLEVALLVAMSALTYLGLMLP